MRKGNVGRGIFGGRDGIGMGGMRGVEEKG